jgi:serine/threonine protein phosphatase PrpC
MGTTLTALCLHGDHALVGHIGDTRLYRLRGGECLQLTEDHSRRDGGNLLTRCVGAGSAACEADHQQFATAPGDRYVLATDGVWGVLSAAELQRCVTRGEPQAVAERLIAAALAAGGPDNATAVVVDVVGVAAGQREQELPRNERADDRGAWPRAIPLRPPLWPWLLLAAAAVVAVLAGLDWAGVDPWAAFG